MGERGLVQEAGYTQHEQNRSEESQLLELILTGRLPRIAV